MQFLRNNIFYVGLIAGVVVIGVVFVLIGRSISADVSANVKLRADVSQGLAGLGKKPYVIRKVIEARAKAVRDTKEKATEVSDNCIRHAMKNYPLYKSPNIKTARKSALNLRFQLRQLLSRNDFIFQILIIVV